MVAENPNMQSTNDTDILLLDESSVKQKKTQSCCRSKVCNTFLSAAFAFSLNAITTWRLPYIYARHGLPFLVAFGVCACFITYPLICAKIFFGHRLTEAQYWANVHPFQRGLAVSLFILMFYVMAYSTTYTVWAMTISYHSFAHRLNWPFLLAGPTPEFNETIQPLWLQRMNGSLLLPGPTLNDSGETTQRNEALLLPVAVVEFFYNVLIKAVPQINSLSKLSDYFVCEVIAAAILFWLVVFVLLPLGKRAYKAALVFRIIFIAALLAAFLLSVILGPQHDEHFALVGMKYLLYKWQGPQSFIDMKVWSEAATQSLLAVGAMASFVWVKNSHHGPESHFAYDGFLVILFHILSSLLTLIICYCGLATYEVPNIDGFLSKLGPSLPYVGYLGIINYWTSCRTYNHVAPIVIFTLFALVQASCHAYNITRSIRCFQLNDLIPAVSTCKVVLMSLAVCLGALVFSYPFTTAIGSYLLQCLDDNLLVFLTLALALAEMLAFACFSIRKICQSQNRRCIGWSVIWRFIPPLLICLVLAIGIASHILDPPSYIAYRKTQKEATGSLRSAPYPLMIIWINFGLIAIALLPLLIIPLCSLCTCRSPRKNAKLTNNKGVDFQAFSIDLSEFPFIDDSVEDLTAI